MKIPRAVFIDSGANHWFGALAVSISVFVFAYSFRYGQASILLYYACWLPLILIDYRAVLGNYARYTWIIAFGVFACLSVFWSDAPSVTARTSLQYVSHIACALIAARTISTRTLCVGLLGGVFLVLLFSFVFGNYIYDPLDGDYSFSGLFTSKNQLGFFASLGTYTAFTYVFMLPTRAVARFVAILVGLFSLVALFASQSATSIIALSATLLTIISFSGALLFSPGTRKLFVAFGLVLGVFLAIVAYGLGAVDMVLGLFGKDSTLTGRTYLWSEGWLAAQDSPFVGLGYQAYWVQGFSEAERLWHEFFVESRVGFHFHNTYIETLVELGYVGCGLISLVIVRVLFGLLRRVVSGPAATEAVIMTGITILLVIRSFFEIDVMHPYAIGSFLLYYSAGRLVGWKTAQLRPRRAAPTGLAWQHPAYSRDHR